MFYLVHNRLTVLEEHVLPSHNRLTVLEEHVLPSTQSFDCLRRTCFT